MWRNGHKSTHKSSKSCENDFDRGDGTNSTVDEAMEAIGDLVVTDIASDKGLWEKEARNIRMGVSP